MPLQVYDWSRCCDSDKDASFFGFMRTLFGYYSSPTNLMVLLYWMYWTGVLLFLGWKLFRGTLYGIIGSPAPPLDLESGNSSLEIKEGSELAVKPWREIDGEGSGEVVATLAAPAQAASAPGLGFGAEIAHEAQGSVHTGNGDVVVNPKA